MVNECTKHCTTYVALKITHQGNISTFFQDGLVIVRHVENIVNAQDHYLV